MAPRKKHLTITRAQHTALQAMLDNRAKQLLAEQHGGGYRIPTNYFADVPWGHAAKLYVRKNGDTAGEHTSLGAMGQRSLAVAEEQTGGSRFTDRLRSGADTAHTAATGLEVAGGVAAATGVGAAATPFVEAAGLGADLAAYGAEGIAGLGDVTGWF